jgi:hypothetical protein
VGVPVAVANYVPVDRAGAWRGRIAASMTYYARRPGRDLEELRAEWDAQGAERRVFGRSFVTADGERIPLREADERSRAALEERREAWTTATAIARAERHAVRDAAFEDRCERFLQGETARSARLSPERREELVERWRHTREARERLPDPAFCIYRVVLSAAWATLDGRELSYILGTALGGATLAVGASLAHATTKALRDAQLEAERLVARQAQRREQEAERAQRAEADRARREQERQVDRQERRQDRADARFAQRFRQPGWLAVEHRNTAHPHWHVVAISDRRLDVADLEAMRERLGERERTREREQSPERHPEPERQRDTGRELW